MRRALRDMPDRYGSEHTLRPDASRRRALVVAVFLCLWMAAVGARLTYLQTSQHEWLTRRARAQQLDVEPQAAARGLILDRQGRELARSVPVDSFFADPREVGDADGAAAALARALGVDEASLAARLKEAKEANRGFVWLARKVDEGRSRAARELKLKGVYWVEEQRRRYPNGALAAHVLGFVGLDERGLAGAVERTRAKSGAAVVLEPRTGEILALANAPSFDPNDAAGWGADARRNGALQNIYEPGSTFKVVAYSGSLEEKLIRPDDRIDCP